MKYIFIFFGLAMLAGLSSCTKVIGLDLNSSDPQTVIEGNINDKPGPYLVKISKSVNFDQSNNFPAVTGAMVVVHDDAGITDTLTEVTPGNYYTHTITGAVGHTYSLTVVAEGKTYTASSYMSPAVPLDSVYTSTNSGFGRDHTLNMKYHDPIGANNFYHVMVNINGAFASDILAYNDRLTNGNVIDRPLRLTEKLNLGDYVTVVLESIDSNVYNYYSTFGGLSGGPGGSSTPANPITNIQGAKLGYFSAYSTSFKSIIVQ